jgi:hypothetical protein
MHVAYLELKKQNKTDYLHFQAPRLRPKRALALRKYSDQPVSKHLVRTGS